MFADCDEVSRKQRKNPAKPHSFHLHSFTFFTFTHLKFIKAVSDTVFGMINAVYHDKPLIFIGAAFLEKLISHQQTVNINC